MWVDKSIVIHGTVTPDSWSERVFLVKGHKHSLSVRMSDSNGGRIVFTARSLSMLTDLGRCDHSHASLVCGQILPGANSLISALGWLCGLTENL